MKKIKSYIFPFIFGALVSGIIVYLFLKHISIDLGDLGEYVNAGVTAISVCFVYTQFIAVHSPKIKIEAVFSPAFYYDDKSGARIPATDNLQVWAVNNSKAAGNFRFVGICKLQDFNKVKQENFYDQYLIFNDYYIGFHSFINKFSDYNPYERIKEGSTSKIITLDGYYLKKFLNAKDGDYVKIIIIYVDVNNKPTTLKATLHYVERNTKIVIK